MERITMQYGMECNYLKCTFAEYQTLVEFLKSLGVEARMVSWDTATDTVEVQARNNYQDNAEMYRNHKIGGLICELSEDEIKSGHWRR